MTRPTLSGRLRNAPALAVRLAAFAVALAVALIAATFAVDAVERRTHAGIVRALAVEGLADWSSVTVDGLRVELAGTAPDEGARFAALAAAGRVVDAQRLTDAMGVAAGPAVPPWTRLAMKRSASSACATSRPEASSRTMARLPP